MEKKGELEMGKKSNFRRNKETSQARIPFLEQWRGGEGRAREQPQTGPR